jgi:hypothetical protein
MVNSYYIGSGFSPAADRWARTQQKNEVANRISEIYSKSQDKADSPTSVAGMGNMSPVNFEDSLNGEEDESLLLPEIAESKGKQVRISRDELPQRLEKRETYQYSQAHKKDRYSLAKCRSEIEDLCEKDVINPQVYPLRKVRRVEEGLNMLSGSRPKRVGFFESENKKYDPSELCNLKLQLGRVLYWQEEDYARIKEETFNEVKNYMKETGCKKPKVALNELYQIN